MNEDLLKILANSNKDIDNQRLMDYLHGRLSAADLHEVERQMADDELFNDAVEGLQQIKNPRNIETYVEQMNRELKKDLSKKRRRREKRRFKDSPWAYVAVIVIIMLCIATYYVIKKYQHLR